MIHSQPHSQAGKTITLPTGEEYQVEDWWDRVSGESWMFCNGNMACIQYEIRCGILGLPVDNEVVYGKVNGLGVLLHGSELEGANND